MHRLVHAVPYLRKIHSDHHAQVTNDTIGGPHWTNLFLYFDSLTSTLDQWITEVIPTILLAMWLDDASVFLFYYIWAAMIQESIEHNPRVNLYPWLSSGRWHLVHHEHPGSNYGVLVPIWDVMFDTWRDIDVGKPAVDKE